MMPTTTASSYSIAFVPTDEATVVRAIPAENFGGESYLRFVDGPGVESLMSFDASLLLGRGGGDNVASATLRLHGEGDGCTALEGGLVLVGVLDDSSDGGSWDEDTVTWTSAPTIGDGGTMVQPLADVLSNEWFEMGEFSNNNSRTHVRTYSGRTIRF